MLQALDMSNHLAYTTVPKMAWLPLEGLFPKRLRYYLFTKLCTEIIFLLQGANGGINRFKVAKVSDDEEFEEEDEDLPLSCYETKNLKSFKHYTKEALPRLDNYRNVMSVHGHLQRPTLDELHGVQTTIQFDRVSYSPCDEFPVARVSTCDGTILT